jgi:phospholipid transport system substrate-binding protein
MTLILILPAVFFAFAGATGATGGQGSPTVVVEKLNTALLAAMRGGKKLGFEGRYALLKPVIDDVFAVETMTRISSGRHWHSLSPEQQKTLTELYSRWSAASYANNFDDYDGQRFDITGESVVGKRADVNSSLLKKDGEGVQFLYKLVQSGETWRIVDIHIKGVSQLSNTRAQFTSILERNGYEGLFKSLQEEIQKLGSGAGERSPLQRR